MSDGWILADGSSEGVQCPADSLVVFWQLGPSWPRGVVVMVWGGW